LAGLVPAIHAFEEPKQRRSAVTLFEPGAGSGPPLSRGRRV